MKRRSAPLHCGAGPLVMVGVGIAMVVVGVVDGFVAAGAGMILVVGLDDGLADGLDVGAGVAVTTTH